MERGTEEFGRSFEHFLIEEVRAFLSYSEKHLPLCYWRTSTGLEVALVAGDMVLAMEFKAVPQADDRHARELRALKQEQRVRRAVLVTLDPTSRTLADGIEVLPWSTLCDRLWAGGLL